MEIWNDFKIRHKGINYDEECDTHFLETVIKDNKTSYEVFYIVSVLGSKTLEFHIGTNEKMLKRLNLPTYKHMANFSYIEGKKNFDQKNKKARDIPCLSFGTGNVKKVIREILDYWKDADYYIKRVIVSRETGNTKNKEIHRFYEIN